VFLVLSPELYNHTGLCAAIIGSPGALNNNVLTIWFEPTGELAYSSQGLNFQNAVYMAPVNTQVHLCVTWNGFNVIFYAYGTQVYTEALYAPLEAPMTAQVLFDDYYSATDGNGTMSCWTVWSTALTSIYVNQLYQAQAGGACSIPGVMSSVLP